MVVRAALLVLVLFLVPVVVFANENGTILFEGFEDFNTAQTMWNWIPQNNPYVVKDGFAYLNVPSDSNVYTHALISNQSWKFVGFEVRLRHPGDPGGLRNFGFSSIGERLRWIWWCNKSDPDFRGLHAVSILGNKFVMHKHIETDIKNWHTYTIIWKPSNATFLLDGEIVAHTTQTPKKPLSLFISVVIARATGTLDNWRIGETPKLLSDQSTEIDYIRLFVSDEKFQEMDSEISGLFAQALSLIDDLEQKNENTTNLRTEYEEAQADWKEDHYFYDDARSRLDRIIEAAEHWDEIYEMFGQVGACIEALKKEGRDREATIYTAMFSKAVGVWEEFDYQQTRSLLDTIITRCPEPILLPILGLVLLSALLRRRR